MTDQTNGLSSRQKWILTGIIAVIVVLGASDVISDLAEGASVGHLGVESIGILLGIAGIAWIWLQNQKLEARGVILGQDLARAHAESAKWKAKSQELLKGLGQAIDDQLRVWSLSSAEREVALLLLKGLSLKEVATVRGTSERTTRQQAQEIYRKTGLSGRAEFSAFFLEELLLPAAVPGSDRAEP